MHTTRYYFFKRLLSTLLFQVLFFVLFIDSNLNAQVCPSCPGFNINETSQTGTLASASGWTNATVARLNSDNGSVSSTTAGALVNVLSTVTTATLNTNFTGFSVPAGKRICAIVIFMNRYATNLINLSGTSDNVNVDGVSGTLTTIPWGTNTASTATITATGPYTPATVNNGVAFSLSVTANILVSVGAITFNIDHITARVFYSDPCPLGIDLLNFENKYNDLKQENTIDFTLNDTRDYDSIRVVKYNAKNFSDSSVVTTYDIDNEYGEKSYSFTDNDISKSYYYGIYVFKDGLGSMVGDYLLVENVDSNKKILKYINLMGEEISEPKGYCIIVYEDLSTKKIYVTQ